MLELSQIIDKLNHVNEQVIEKDNALESMSKIVEIVSTMLDDADFIRSDIYLDLKLKYLTNIKNLLEKLKNKQIQIEPECTKINKDQRKHFTINDVNGPIQTNIYVSPKTLRTFKKILPPSTSQLHTDQKKKYVSFDYNKCKYYIDIIAEKDHYNIYNDLFELRGQLCGSHITLLGDNDPTILQTIQLPTIHHIQTPEQKILFGQYFTNNLI